MVLDRLEPYSLAGGEEIFLRGGEDPKVDWGLSISILPAPVAVTLPSAPLALTAFVGLFV